MSSTAYSGLDNDEKYKTYQSKLITRKQIKETIQASEEELTEALFKLKTIEINGFIRLIDKNALR